MIGDANAPYVTVFDDGVTVQQVVTAALLQMDFQFYKKEKIRHYSRGVSSAPSTQLVLNVTLLPLWVSAFLIYRNADCRSLQPASYSTRWRAKLCCAFMTSPVFTSKSKSAT
ncbi:hypothetical protein [Sphingomonas sp. Leaf242]|uniref:hypothetical protein n=1 Tax=Sphingomonas sp. Leaf242 TaxID=1736304 RepID=UPI00071517F7|nr:hypothetical protein [Sphingomonas sp. Leaf242]KQO12921.1 hypothetical protein ASF09_01030 [Sphingomonas sp. Leaf242]